jgi:hypothetical protein
MPAATPKQLELVFSAPPRPRTRADCVNGPRPCPWVACKYNLTLDVRREEVAVTFPDREPWELRETCALDVAARGGATLEEVGALLNISDERVRQIAKRGLLRLQAELTEEETDG